MSNHSTSEEGSSDTVAPGENGRPTRRRRLAVITAALLGLYLLAAYVLVPLAWEQFARRHPSFDNDPRITQTSDGHPGDPLNVALIGRQDELERLMRAAGWRTAKALGLESDLKIAADTVLSRPDEQAPVSSLYLFGRRQDLAFEKPVGHSPRQRHHVRFWQRPTPADDGRPVWLGSATFDKGVGLSHTTGQITHHIDGNIDDQRDQLIADLQQTGDVAETYTVEDFHTTREGRNGGGDAWHTDGDLVVGVIAPK
jgi:hypothetical protein